MHGYDLLYLVNMMISRTTRTLCRVFPAMLVTLATWNYRNEAELRGGRDVSDVTLAPVGL